MRVGKTIEIFYDILLPLELCKSPSKVQEMAFQRLVFNFFPGACPQTAFECHGAKCAPTFRALRRP